MPRNDSSSSNTMRSLISLCIFLHLFVVVVALVGNVRRSALQRRLLAALAPYAESLGFVASRSVNYYTHADPRDDDHFLELDISAKSGPVTEIFPRTGSNWSPARRREFSFAQHLGILVEEQDDNLAAVLVRGLAVEAMNRHQADKVVVRCKRRLTQPLHLEDLLPEYSREDPTHATYDRIIYAADIFRDEDGMVQVAKRSSSLEVAPRQPGN